MDNDKKYMRKCISLAIKGQGKTSPNPMVGCVVLNKFGNIISTGYHKKYGANHAERDALLKLKDCEEEGGTLFVNLEPCSHWGKTPPCVDLIIERKLAKVVIGTRDTNSVASGGMQKLKDNGIEVVSGVLENECQELNEIFFTNIEKKRVFIALKTATTIDGKIATNSGDSKWITSEKARLYGKKLRKHYQAILTSSNTILADNPEMEHNNKIILDKNFRTDFSQKIYTQGKIYLVVDKNLEIKDIPSNVELIKCPVLNDKIDLKFLIKELFKKNITSIFVEAGGELSGAFIKEDLVDTIYHFIAPKILNDNSGKSCFDGDNVSKIANCKNYKLKNVKQLNEDVLLTYKMPF